MAEAMPENQTMTMDSTSMESLVGWVSAMTFWEKNSMSPALTVPPMMMKRPMKKKMVGHSTSSNTFCGSSPEMSSRVEAPSRATVAGS